MGGRFKPRPKREAEAFARTHNNDEDFDGHVSKKPRFDPRNPSVLVGDAADDDAVLEADEVGQGQGIGVKRNAVNIDGYDSDSDPDVERWKRDNAADVAEDMFVDMVGGDADEGEEDDGRRKEKKQVRFLNEGDIQGQVMSSTSGGHVSANLLKANSGKKPAKGEEESDSSDSGDDELRATVPSSMDDELGAGSKKKHAPRLEAFNLRTENEEGKFDESGNYVRKAGDPNAVHDSWLDGLSKRDMKSAREAHEKREEERRQKDLEKDSLLTSDLYGTLIKHLHPGETALEALQRLGKNASKNTKASQRKKIKRRDDGEGMEVDAVKEDDATRLRREAVEAITEAAMVLQDRYQLDIYDMERELLMRSYKRDTGDDWKDPAVEPTIVTGDPDEGEQWFFRWADNRDGVDRHGPYDRATMKAWIEAGYFGDGVEFKSVGNESWTRVIDLG